MRSRCGRSARSSSRRRAARSNRPSPERQGAVGTEPAMAALVAEPGRPAVSPRQRGLRLGAGVAAALLHLVIPALILLLPELWRTEAEPPPLVAELVLV